MRGSHTLPLFETHRGQTERQVERLEQVFRLLGEKAEGVPCEAIKGIVREGWGKISQVSNE